MSNMLDRIVQYKEQELDKLRLAYSSNCKPQQYRSSSHCFRSVFQAHNRVIIGEIKRRSPSRGNFSDISDPAVLARSYLQAGAGALSVLTDSYFFGGSSQDLSYLTTISDTADCPKLRKDFIIDPVQLDQSVHIGADAVLLIAKLLPSSLRRMVETARALNLAPLVEVHNRKELEQALDAGADIIGVNNRDLQTFHVDVSVSFSLISDIPDHVVAIAESGIHDVNVAQSLFEVGYRGLLMGEALVTSAEPGQLIHAIRGGVNESAATD